MIQTISRGQVQVEGRRSRSGHDLPNQDTAQDRQGRTIPVSYHCTYKSFQAIHIKAVKPVEREEFFVWDAEHSGVKQLIRGSYFTCKTLNKGENVRIPSLYPVNSKDVSF